MLKIVNILDLIKHGNLTMQPCQIDGWHASIPWISATSASRPCLSFQGAVKVVQRL